MTGLLLLAVLAGLGVFFVYEATALVSGIWAGDIVEHQPGILALVPGIIGMMMLLPTIVLGVFRGGPRVDQKGRPTPGPFERAAVAAMIIGVLALPPLLLFENIGLMPMLGYSYCENLTKPGFQRFPTYTYALDPAQCVAAQE